MIKILRLEWVFFKLSLIADLQQPFNILMQFFNDILWYGFQIALFESLYLHISELGGWHLPEMRIFLGVLFFTDACQMVFFAYNFDHFGARMSRGDLDLVLIKPVSAQCLMCMPRLQCGFFLNLLFASIWLGWSLSLLEHFHWSIPLLLLIVIPAGLAIFYAVRLVFASLAVVMVHAESFTEIFFSLFRLGTRPDRLYSNKIRYLILMVFPVAMIASVPTRILVESFELWRLLALLTVSVGSLWVANRFWQWTIHRYTSGS